MMIGRPIKKYNDFLTKAEESPKSFVWHENVDTVWTTVKVHCWTKIWNWVTGKVGNVSIHKTSIAMTVITTFFQL